MIIPGGDGIACNDNSWCTINDQCRSGTCQGNMRDIDDGYYCTDDYCEEVTQTVTHTSNDALCNDNLYCNGVETCSDTAGCISGTAPAIDDNVDCTEDLCDEGNDLVTHTTINSLCWNGLWCDGNEICHETQGCISGTAETCNDGISCTIDSCSEGVYPNDNVGTCLVDTSQCSCTTNSQCNDNNPCTTDTCDGGQCLNDPNDGASCTDGFYCTINDRCQNGQCVSDPRNIDDTISCTTDLCDEDADIILHVPNHDICSNGLYCDGQETCSSVSGCIGGIVPSINDGITCTIDSCDEVNDEISHTSDHSICQNGLWCDGEERCDTQFGCIGENAPNCADSLSCSTDSCDEGTLNDDNIGECIHDFLTCTCQTSYDCSDGNPCTTDTCTNNQCSFTNNNQNACTDGLFCTTNDRCSNGKCISDPRIYDDNITCTFDSCDETYDRVMHIEDDGICDDSLYCNGAEYCKAGEGCVQGTSPICNDDEPCTADACNNTLVSCTFKPIDNDGDTFSICEGVHKDCNDNDAYINFFISEICDNGKDDDCDNLLDTSDPDCFSCTPDDTKACNKQEGICSGVFVTCNADGTWPACDDSLYYEHRSAYLPDSENCSDNLDNDCDGDVNENCVNGTDPTGGSNVCKPLWVKTEWGDCQDDGFRYRTVTDNAMCNDSTSVPPTVEQCTIGSSCTDGIKNGNEDGIDCGGDCPTICPTDEEPNLIPPSIKDLVSISADDISGEILSEYEFDVTIENDGQVALSNLAVTVNKWSDETQPIDDLQPGDSRTVTFEFRLPDNPDHSTLTIDVQKKGKIIQSSSVATYLTVPDFAFRILRTLKSDPIAMFIADNRNNDKRNIVTEFSVYKDKEIYFFDTISHLLKKDEVYHRSDEITGLATLGKGSYTVESRIFEDGKKIGETTSQFEIKGDKEVFNAAFIFYLLLLAIICAAGYVFYLVIKR